MRNLVGHVGKHFQAGAFLLADEIQKLFILEMRQLFLMGSKYLLIFIRG